MTGRRAWVCLLSAVGGYYSSNCYPAPLSRELSEPGRSGLTLKCLTFVRMTSKSYALKTMTSFPFLKRLLGWDECSRNYSFLLPSSSLGWWAENMQNDEIKAPRSSMFTANWCCVELVDKFHSNVFTSRFNSFFADECYLFIIIVYLLLFYLFFIILFIWLKFVA